MKQKLIAWSRPLLCAAIAYSWWFYHDFASIGFFGEYKYPNDSDAQ